MKVLQLITDHDISYCLNHVSEDEQFLSLTLSINLNKVHQKKAVKQIEELLSAPNPFYSA